MSTWRGVGRGILESARPIIISTSHDCEPNNIGRKEKRERRKWIEIDELTHAQGDTGVDYGPGNREPEVAPTWGRYIE